MPLNTMQFFFYPVVLKTVSLLNDTEEGKEEGTEYLDPSSELHRLVSNL